ncbi:MAG: glycosyltransferase [Nitrospira sp.]|nr:glycosyltransferase [Nitrospira sp.]
MREENPLVSIIVRTKDRPKLLMRALQSIAGQTYSPVEVVLVNDGGSDLNVPEIKSILGDITLNYIRLAYNTGRANAANVGIDNSSGEYIGFLDDDDEYYPEHLSTLLSFLKNNTGFSGVYTDSEIFIREYDDDGNIVSEHNDGVFRSWDFSYETLLFENYIPLICTVVKKEVLSAIGGFDNSLGMFEDWDLFIRASWKKPFRHISEVTTKYIQWSKVHQIAFINSPKAPECYLQVLSKHSGKITPEVVYRYFLIKQEEITLIKDRLQASDLSKKILLSQNMDLENLLRKTHAKTDEFTRKLDEAEWQKEELRDMLRESEEEKEGFRERLKEVETGNEWLRGKLNVSKTENKELRDKTKEMQALIKELSSKNIHIECQLSQMQELKEKLKQEQAQLQDSREHVKGLEEALFDNREHVKGLEEALFDNREHVKGLEEALFDNREHVKGLEEALFDNREHVKGLEEALFDNREHVKGLEEALFYSREHVKGLEEALFYSREHVKGLENALQEKQEEVRALEGALKESLTEIQNSKRQLLVKQDQMNRLKEELLQKTLYIEEVQTGIGWKILVNYRKNVRNKLAPVGTKRRIAYDKLLKRIRFRGRVHPEHLAEDLKSGAFIKQEQFIVPVISDNTVEAINIKVSVIIPTKNAGQDFYHVIEGIRKQKGIKDIELVIVDSGSKDDTLNISKRYGAKILSIGPSEFCHGRTRNYGAQSATGDYLVFLSQDAIPAGDTCFFDMVRGMNNDPDIAAVSARQVPRSDADLFACWQIWNHYEKFLRYKEDTVISVDRKTFDSLLPSDKRRVAQLDNIFSCIRSDVFNKFRFNDLKYAEDLDLGLRLIKKGFKIGFLSSVGAIHSHNREPLYYFKRSFVDRKSLIHLLGDEPFNWFEAGIGSFSEMIQYVMSVYRTINNTIGYIAQSETTYTSHLSLFNLFRQIIRTCPSGTNGTGSKNSMHSVMDELLELTGGDEAEISVHNDVLLQQFMSALEVFEEYVTPYENVHETIDDIVSALHKLCAVVIGSGIGDYAAFHEVRNGKGLKYKLESIFGEGV